MRYHIFPRAAATPAQSMVMDKTADEFLDWLAAQPSKACESEDAKIKSPGIVLAQYTAAAVRKHYSQLAPNSAISVFLFDLDGHPVADIPRLLTDLAFFNCVVYSTFKNTKALPKLRLALAVDMDVPNFYDWPFRGYYETAAEFLGIKADPHADSRAHLYFLPQHKPENAADVVMHRFRGEPFPVSAVELKPPPVKEVAEFETASQRPKLADLTAYARKLIKSPRQQNKKIGACLDAVLTGFTYAPDGHRHNARLALAGALIKEWPALDAEWFSAQYMVHCERAAGGTAEDMAKRETDWLRAVEYAQKSVETHTQEREIAQAAVAPPPKVPLTPEQLAVVRSLAGAVIVSFRTAYFIFNAYEGRYKGPFQAGEIATAFRECLGGVPGFTELEYYGAEGPVVLKTASKLCHEYGCTVKMVHFYHSDPPVHYSKEEEAIKIRAYRWIKWPAVFHKIADDLLRTMAGPEYPNLEKWLYKLCDLDTPLPALALIGEGGTWKSRLCQTLSRFWTNKDAPSACQAPQVLNRFSSQLLENPVIWSDEELARTENGKEMPEKYRKSISEKAQSIEIKNVQNNIPLFSATRHVVAVNATEKLWPGEINAAAIAATVERFFLINIEKAAMNDFEDRWRGTPELERLREGSSILEHVKYLQTTCKFKSESRFFLTLTHDQRLLDESAFANPTVSYCLAVCLEQLEAKLGHKMYDISALPMTCDTKGQLRINSNNLQRAWVTSKLVEGSQVKKPSAEWIGRTMFHIGIRKDRDTRCDGRKDRAWEVNHSKFNAFLRVNEDHDWESFSDMCFKIFKVRPMKPKELMP